MSEYVNMSKLKKSKSITLCSCNESVKKTLKK